MLNDILQQLPPDVGKVVLVLFLSFLVGIEREEQRPGTQRYRFGGVRTFPLIGLVGYALALLGGDRPWLLAAGLVVIGGFMLLSYQHKLASDREAGITTEVSAIAVYVVGGMVLHGYIWQSCALVVIALLLLELKSALETLAARIAGEEIATFTKFLLLTIVILPIVPNDELTSFRINPFKGWLAIVAVSGISYGSYVLRKFTRQRGGLFLSAILGGAYSSTVTTVVLARHDPRSERPYLVAGSILTASGVMYARLVILVGLFSAPLGRRLALPFCALAALAIFVGWVVARRAPESEYEAGRDEPLKHNPLQLRAALAFGCVFVTLLVVMQLVMSHLGPGATFGVAALMGFFDVDPFILGVAQTVGKSTPLDIAAVSVVIAAASNNVIKGIYAYGFSRGRTGRAALALLVCLAILGLGSLLVI